MSGITIHSNGSKWAGQAEDPLETLLELLGKEPLCPHRAENGVVENLPDDQVMLRGNFHRVSHVFRIEGPRKELAPVIAAIEKNLRSPEYRKAASGIRKTGDTTTFHMAQRACA